MNKNQKSLVLWALAALVVSILLTKFFWCAFCADTTAKESFGIFGVWITIFGFYIGIDQIAKLRDEKQIIHDTKISERLDDVNSYLDEVITSLSFGINIYVIRDCIHILKKISHKITALKIEGCELLNCDDFNRTINEIVQELGIVIQNEELIKLFSSTVYEVRVNDLRSIVVNAKVQLNEI